MPKNLARAALAVVLAAVVLVSLALRTSITRSIDGIAATALAARPESPDQVTALISLVADVSRPVADRDRAV